MGAPVILNVYDLHDNSWIYWCGIGEVLACGVPIKQTPEVPEIHAPLTTLCSGLI